MKLNKWLVFDIAVLTGFWIFTLCGGIDAYNTIAFFEPEFTYCLIGVSVLTGMLIGGLCERWDQEKKREAKTVTVSRSNGEQK